MSIASSIVAGVHFVPFLLQEQHVGFEQFDFVVDQSILTIPLFGFRVYKISDFIIKRKTARFIGPAAD